MRLCLAFLPASLLGASLLAQDLPITGISHVNFRVSNLDVARGFYTGVLGYPEAFTIKKPDGNSTVSLKVNDSQFIELSTGLKPEEAKRLTHISLVTSDMPLLHRMLTERGLAPTPLRPAGADGTLGIRITDPDGNPLEFTEYLTGSRHALVRGKFNDSPRVSTHISHAGVATTHPDAALAFYKDKLGFREVWPLAPGNEKLKQWNLQVPGSNGDYIELMTVAEPLTRERWGGVQHLCLAVADIQAAWQFVSQRGAKPSKPAIGKTRRWLFNVYDPDGSRIEFIEPRLASTGSAP